MTRNANATTALSIAFAAVLTTGCADNANQRLTVGDSIPLASFPPEVVEVQLDQDGNPLPPAPPADDPATARGLDRSNFAPIVYHVPIDGTRHEFHGWDHLALTNETARQRGEFPTATSALETGGNASTRRQIVEAFAQPVYAAGGIASSLLVSSSGARTSPAGLWERAPLPADPTRTGVSHAPMPETTDGTAPADSSAGTPASDDAPEPQ